MGNYHPLYRLQFLKEHYISTSENQISFVKETLQFLLIEKRKQM